MFPPLSLASQRANLDGNGSINELARPNCPRRRQGGSVRSSEQLAPFQGRLSLALIAAPMFLVSGIELVVAACRNGVIGAFPTVNCRSPEELDRWLATMSERLRGHEVETGKRCAPICPNLIVHRSNTRLHQDLQILLKHRPEVVITSVG